VSCVHANERGEVGTFAAEDVFTEAAAMGEVIRSELTPAFGAEQLATLVWSSDEAHHHIGKRCGNYTHHVVRRTMALIGGNINCIEGFDALAFADTEIAEAQQWSCRSFRMLPTRFDLMSLGSVIKSARPSVQSALRQHMKADGTPIRAEG